MIGTEATINSKVYSKKILAINQNITVKEKEPPKKTDEIEVVKTKVKSKDTASKKKANNN